MVNRNLLKSFRPLFFEYVKLKGLGFRHPFVKIRVCEYCGRKEDWIFDFVKFVTIYENEKLIDICFDHGPEVTNCLTGETVLLKNRGLFFKVLRNFIQFFILNVAKAIRFIYFSIKWILLELIFEIRLLYYGRTK